MGVQHNLLFQKSFLTAMSHKVEDSFEKQNNEECERLLTGLLHILKIPEVRNCIKSNDFCSNLLLKLATDVEDKSKGTHLDTLGGTLKMDIGMLTGTLQTS